MQRGMHRQDDTVFAGNGIATWCKVIFHARSDNDNVQRLL